MPSFNLAYEPWIPCLLRGESLPQELSLLDTLTRAHEIRELSDDSPLVTIALHRLLLAILHRNFGPPGFSEWKRLWQRGQWDAEKLAGYFAEWKQRFDLFDVERPFYQTLFIEGLKSDPLALLAQELSSGNNATLFDHNFGLSSQEFTPSQAARFLLSRQAFAFSGTGGYLNSTLVDGYTVLALGRNLFETLSLNLLPYNDEQPIPQRKDNGRSKDLPIWEQDQPQEPGKSYEAYALGYLDYLTWQSRQVHLIAEEETGMVRHCQHLQKLKLKTEQGILDPFKCYDRNRESGFRARQLEKEKVLWRDCHSLFEEATDPISPQVKRPEIFNHLASINAARRKREIEALPAYSFAVYGMVNKQASVSAWLRERLPLPLSYLSDKQLTNALHDALQLAEKTEDVLSIAIKKLAVALVGKEDWSDLAKSFQAKEFYWSRLEAHFRRSLVDLADEFENGQEGETTLPEWARTVTRTANAAFEQAINSLSGSARELQASAIAQTEFDKLMGKTRKTFARLFPQTSTAQSTNGGQS